MKTSKNYKERNVVIYTRVSTDEQKENGFSLQDQYAKLVKHCERGNFNILAHYQDDHSAKNFNRPSFNAFLEDVKSKKIKPDMFLCVRPDRFSRNLENTLSMLTKFRKFGIEFRTLENHTDLDSPESLLPFIVNNLLPQIDNERKGLNTKQCMRQAMREGRTMGRPPVGYMNDKINKTIVLHPTNAPLIKKGFELLSGGVYSIEEVRQMLIKDGLRNCCKQNFLYTVKNPYYYGLIKIPAWKDEPEMEVIGLHEPLISREVFDEVQDIISGRKKNTPSKLTRKDELPLRGHLSCQRCGGKLTGSRSTSRNGSRIFYYHCQKGCKERFRADASNESFEEFLGSFVISEQVLGLYIEILKDVFGQGEVERNRQLKIIDDNIEKVKSRLYNLENNFLDEKIDVQDYQGMKRRLQSEIEELGDRKEEFTIEKTDLEKYFEYGSAFLYDMKKYYREAPLEIKQKIDGSIFPENLVFSENKYRTTQINKLLKILTLNINGLGEIKKGQEDKNINLSNMAPPAGLEPATL